MLSFLLITLAAVFDAERDKIQFDPKRSWFPLAPFWITRNYMEKRLGGSWLFDTVLSFANDGWHLCKSLHLVCLIAGASLLPFNFWFILGAIVVYSIAFEISYKGKI